MIEAQNSKRYDLEERTLKFSKRVIQYIHHLPKTLSNIEIARQLVRAAGSVGANYIEANEALGKKDFVLRAKTSRKEAKESRYWLELTEPQGSQTSEKDSLIREATELLKIFNSIVKKSQCFFGF